MKTDQHFEIKKLSFLRKAVIASASVTKQKNAIHFFTEIDISKPIELIDEYKTKKGEKISFTGYLAKSFSNVIVNYPSFNSFISGNRHVLLKKVNISILVERKIGDELLPEPLILTDTANRSLLDIHNEIRKMQKLSLEKQEFGNLSNNSFFKYIPSFLLKAFVKLADKNIQMGVKYGKLSITSVGMFCTNPIWVIPHGTATVLLSVGSINEKIVQENDIKSIKKHLCLTVSFDHNIIDGAPAARFMDDLINEIKSGKSLIESSLG